MAQQVHDATGRVCDHCGRIFPNNLAFNMSVRRRVKGLIIKERVCRPCANTYYEARE